VDLFVALALLYLIQCVAWLPAGATWLLATRSGVRSAEGPGFRLQPLRPAARAVVGLRFPLESAGGVLRARGHASGWRRDREAGDPVPLEQLAAAEARELLVFSGKRVLARGTDAAHAERIAALLRDLAGAEPAVRRKRADAALRESLSLSAAGQARDRFDDATGWLAAASDSYAVALLVLTPAAALFVGSELTLVIGAPALALLHVLTLVAFGRAHARLAPERRAERWQALLGVAFYPPGLLRGHALLRAGMLGRFQPAALALALLPRDAARDFLRAELVLAEARGSEVAPELGFSLERCQHDALLALVEESGESLASLCAAPARSDPLALAFCPACHCEYRRGDGDCSDCEVALAAFAGG
jgi:hypothetical protein